MAEAEVNDTVKEGIGYWDAKLKPFTEWYIIIIDIFI